MNHGIPHIGLLGVVLAILVAAVFPAPAEAQLGRLRNAAKNALQREIEFQIDRPVPAVRCVMITVTVIDTMFGDPSASIEIGR